MTLTLKNADTEPPVILIILSDDLLNCLDLEEKYPTRDAVTLMRRDAAQLLTNFPEIKLGVFCSLAYVVRRTQIKRRDDGPKKCTVKGNSPSFEYSHP